MQAVEARPADWNHLARGVELHRARAEGDHRRRQRQIAVLESLQIAQHLRFGMMRVEDGMGAEGRGARQRFGNCGPGLQGRNTLRPQIASGRRRKHAHDVGQIIVRNRLIERHADSCLRQGPQVDLLDARGIEDPGQRILRHLDRQRIEEVGIGEPVAQFFQGRGERGRVRVHAPRDPAQPLRAMINGVHGGDHGEQHLCGANVARRLLAPDVLLARLQRHAQRGPPGAVFGHADDAAGEVALELVARREEGGVRAAVAERDAEALRVADGDVGAPRPGRGEQGQREQVGRDGHQGACSMRGLAERAVVADRAVGRGILDERADRAVLESEGARIGDDDIDPARGGPRADDRDRLRMAVHVHQIGQLPLVLRDRLGEMHRLGSGGAFVE